MLGDAQTIPIKPVFQKMGCSLILKKRMVRMRGFLTEMYSFICYVKTFDAGEVIGARSNYIMNIPMRAENNTTRCSTDGSLWGEN